MLFVNGNRVDFDATSAKIRLINSLSIQREPVPTTQHFDWFQTIVFASMHFVGMAARFLPEMLRTLLDIA